MNASMRTIAAALAVALAPGSVSARASQPEPEAPVDALAEAKAWHLEADAKYNTADYEGAITSWQKAFAALPRTAEANTYRSLILYNIAAAREKLFALRGDVEHLKQARILLQQFEASIDETYAGAPEQGEQERARVQAKLATIEAQIQQAEQASEPATDEPTEPPPPTTTPTTDAPPRRSLDDVPGRTYLIVGGVMTGLAVAAGAGMGAALGIGAKANDLDGIDDDDLDARKDKFDRGRRANTGAFAAGTIGAVCLAAGIALLVIGAKRRKAQTAFTPVVGRGLAGFAVGGRF